tara:strand:+ start:204573 stop:204917 length:345 start_codon:yes stop_codon:yes gene_type:complete
MAKGREKHQARLDAISFQGKDLARRAKRKCEFCEGSGDLRAFDGDEDAEPSLETLVLACERCRAVLGGRKDDERTLRFLETAIWNEEPVIARLAKQMLGSVDADWARGALEMVS